MSTLYSFQKPYKVWSYDRQQRKSVVASSLLELKIRGAEKLGYSEDGTSELKVVLEADGTEVEDDGYFQTAEKDTIFILLRIGEVWLPLGVEALKTALSAIPGLVSDALNKLEQSDKLPNWKVSDSNGVITVVLQWDTRDRLADGEMDMEDIEMDIPMIVTTSVTDHTTTGTTTDARPSTGSPSILKRSSSSAQPPQPSPPILKTSSPVRRPPTIPLRVPIILPDIETPSAPRPVPELIGMGGMEYSSDSSDGDDDQHPSPTHEHAGQCDFHCAAVHRQIQMKKRSVATSPIIEVASSLFGVPHHHHLARMVQSSVKSAKPTSGKYVRFQDLEPSKSTGSDEESDTETSTQDEQMSERYLLLSDQLSIGHDKHLTVKDIGCILERLNFKIIDVDRLERDIESSDCHNWMIRALVRGDGLREIGVVYNSQYYGIVEHPGFY